MPFTLPKPVVYVVRDIERALGLPLTTKGYYIISNYTPFANSLAKGRKNVLLIKNKELLDTRELLTLPKVKKFINTVISTEAKRSGEISCGGILVFKNTLAIEKVCGENNWPLLNPSAVLATKVEEKITQVEWLGELKKFLPPFEIKTSKEIKWTGTKFILQFNRAHTGSGTILVENENQLKEIQSKFPNREVRVTNFIEGAMLTNNNVVWGKKVLCGNINYQITGLKPFTNLPFATIGNDWALPHKLLNAKQKKEYQNIAHAIGLKLAIDGWCGLFGIDVMFEKKTGKLYLIEINARQPASTSFESQLQMEKNKNGLTIFQAHLSALLNGKNAGKLTMIKDGAQITQKVIPVKKQIELKRLKDNIKEFSRKDFETVYYKTNKSESDWLRVQSNRGAMKSHNIINSVGQDIVFFALTNLEAKRLSKRYEKDRVAAIITNNSKILLMKRTRFGKEYFVLPGGTVEKGESLLEALMREIDEETGLKIAVSKKKPIIIKISDRREHHYFVDSYEGEPILGGEEKEKNSPENNYQLIWKDIFNSDDIDFYPADLKDKIFNKK
ncbi:MAG: hypothetical protein ACD_72C00264G0001 [uncultured bacterium]|nr:MAG: hypothetical protein ACD_72C00264G0001 [uncultured bacterium]